MNARDLPSSLWHDNKILLPENLATCLADELRVRGLFERSRLEKPSTRILGGADAADALDHFTFMFKSSAARVQLVALNPTGKFETFSADLLNCLFDGRLSILDVPCGSGGGLLGLLCTVAELRRAGRLARTPLQATVVAGDISADAIDVHRAMLSRVQGGLAEQGIRISWEHLTWDVRPCGQIVPVIAARPLWMPLGRTTGSSGPSSRTASPPAGTA